MVIWLQVFAVRLKLFSQSSVWQTAVTVVMSEVLPFAWLVVCASEVLWESNKQHQSHI